MLVLRPAGNANRCGENATMYRFYLVANAHLDPVWLWDGREGLNQGIQTCRTMLDLRREAAFLESPLTTLSVWASPRTLPRTGSLASLLPDSLTLHALQTTADGGLSVCVQNGTNAPVVGTVTVAGTIHVLGEVPPHVIQTITVR